MEDMIAAQVSLPEALTSVAGEAEQLLEALRKAADQGQPIVTTACGTSEHASQALALILSDALGVVVEARQSLEQTLNPRSGGVCLAVSHGGLSKATVSALRSARQQGAFAALITAAPVAPSHEHADLILSTPLRDASMCHTVGYTSPILVGLMLADIHRGEQFPVRALTSHLERLIGLQAHASVVAATLGDVGIIVSAGSGIDRPAAREFALKVAEGARVATSVIELENVLHGHLVALDDTSGLLVVVTNQHGDRERAERAREVVAGARRIGLHCILAVSEELADVAGVDADDGQALLIPTSPELNPLASSLLGSALALQTLTVGLVHERETNPDLLRREETPYREAVSVGNTKFPRPVV
jgi:fructoselysine-6-P-deglycase FrlB-like protein